MVMYMYMYYVFCLLPIALDGYYIPRQYMSPENNNRDRVKRYTSDEKEAFDFLTKYGYIKPNELEDIDLHEALRIFQEKYYLYVDGTYNNDTRILMSKPRCMRGDTVSNYETKRTKWNKTELVWYFPNADENVINSTRRAFEIWANSTVLQFKQTTNPAVLKPDIEIAFARRQHKLLPNCMGGDSCGFPFDGKGRVLAHAYFPSPGVCIDVHLDGDEEWEFETTSKSEKTNFLNVLSHELGHSLGLEHSSVESALMYPWYHDVDRLDDDDIRGIEFLYGKKTHNTSSPTITPSIPTTATQSYENNGLSEIKNNHDICQIVPHFIFLANGPRFSAYRLYVGYFNNLWRIDIRSIIIPSRPDPLLVFTKGTALEHRRIDHIFQLNEDDIVVISQNTKFIISFPQLKVKSMTFINNLQGYIINAAFQSNSGKTFIFFNYDSYIEYGNTPFTIETGRGLISDLFPGLPSREIRFGFKWIDGHLYFLTQYYYYKYNEYTKTVVEMGAFKWTVLGIQCPDQQLLYQLKTALNKIIRIYDP